MASKRSTSQTRGRTPSESALAETTPTEVQTEFRLQKFLASAGLGSRRQCEELIRTGRITVDGLPVENPGINVRPLEQLVEYDGERLKPERLKYFVLNKPKGVLCTNHDPAGRTRVIDLFQKERTRLFPVGRLDEDSEGLLIVTNDGDLANQLAHPRYRIYRTYLVQVVGFPTNEKLQQLKDGMFFRDGKFKVMNVRRVKKQGKSCFLEVVLGQGHNREVRRLFARVGHKVISLERTAFGPIKLRKLKPGEYRPLTKRELEELRDILTRNRSTPGPEPRPTRRPPRGNAESQQTRPGKRGSLPRQTGDQTETASAQKNGAAKKRIRRPASPTANPVAAKSTAKSTASQRPGRKQTGKQSSRSAIGSGKGKPKTHDFH